MSLEPHLLARLEASPDGNPLRLGKLHEDIEDGLGEALPKSEVLRTLKALQGRGMVDQKGAGWSLVMEDDPEAGTARSEDGETVLSLKARGRWEKFRRLLGYYIECLRYDENASFRLFEERRNKQWITVAMYQNWDKLEGTRLSLELTREHSPFTLHTVTQRDEELFVGYPVYVVKRSGLRFYVPVYCVPVTGRGMHHNTLSFELDYDSTDVNADWLKYSCPNKEARNEFLRSAGLRDPGRSDEDDGQEWASEEDGFFESSTFDMKRLLDALQLFHGEAIGDRELDPHRVKPLPPIGQLEEGIHNGMVVFSGRRLKYAASLVRELRRLQMHAKDEEFEKSALRHLFFPDRHRAKNDDEPVVFPVLDLTRSQFSAVCNSATAGLSVVTGPPGTGKSQVVSVALASTVLRGESAVFASRNNQPLDAVVPRLNALSNALPVIRKQGDSSKAQFSWEKIIDEILSAPPMDEEVRGELEERQGYVTKKSGELFELIVRFQQLSKLKQVASTAYWAKRKRLADPLFSRFDVDALARDENLVPELERFAETMVEACDQLDGRREPAFWRFLHRKRWRKLKEVAEGALRRMRELSGVPPGYLSEVSYLKLLERAEKLAGLLKIHHQHDQAKAQCVSGEEMEAMCDEIVRCLDELRTEGIDFLRMFLQLKLTLKDDEEKRIFATAKSLFDQLNDKSASGQVLGEVSDRLSEAFKRLVVKVPLLAVTNLRGTRAFPATHPAQFDLLVVDEASQCDVPSTIPLLFRAKRACVIGDPKQLKAIHSMKASTNAHLKEKHGVRDDIFAPYDYLGFSFFDLANLQANRPQTTLLREHFRCHSQIASYCNDVSYNGALRVFTDERHLVAPKGAKTGLHWTDIVGSCETVSSSGCICKEEVTEVTRIVLELAEGEQQGISVGVVSPFRAQANRIQDELEKKLPAAGWNRLNLVVNTADGFQGDERDVIVFSVGCQPNMPRGSLWFVSQDKNRWNVAVSRARALLRVVGNLSFCSASEAPHVRRLAEHATRQNQPADKKADTQDEINFHEALKRVGIETVPQHPLAGHRLDLAIPDEKIDIEVDGKEFHLDRFGNRIDSDVWRDVKVRSLGWKVLRFWVYELREDMDACVRKVSEALN